MMTMSVLPLIFAVIYISGFLIFLCWVFYDYIINKKIKQSAIEIGDGLPKYRITECSNLHASHFNILFRVEWLTHKGWIPCQCYPESVCMDVSYNNRLSCEEWIQTQLNKFSPERWDPVRYIG